MAGLGEFTNKQGFYASGRLAGASVASHLRPSVTAELWYSRVTLHGKSGRVGAGHVLVPGFSKSFLLDGPTQPYVIGGFGFWRRDGTTATPVASAAAGLKRFYGEYFYVRPELRFPVSDLGGRATGNELGRNHRLGLAVLAPDVGHFVRSLALTGRRARCGSQHWH